MKTLLLKQFSLTTRSIGLAILFLLIRWFEYHFLLLNLRLEIYSIFLAVVFTTLGVWMSNRLQATKQISGSNKASISIARELDARKHSGTDTVKLSDRELQVLQQIALGFSNQEIADCLFVSLNTIKTHNANIMSKLNVKRRTQAVQKARTLGML